MTNNTNEPMSAIEEHFTNLKIYGASKTNHAMLWRDLRDKGYNIISTWIDEAGRGQTKDRADLAQRCIREAAECDLLILYAESGDTLKDANVEYGAALAAGKPVFIVGESDTIGNTIRCHPLVRSFPDMLLALAAAAVLKPRASLRAEEVSFSRYHPDFGANMTYTLDGEYVRYDDVAPVIAELRLENEELRKAPTVITWSRDYEQLYERVMNGERVPCYVDYREKYRDIAEVKRCLDSSRIDIGARGISYDSYGKTKAEFLADCQRMNLDFLAVVSEQAQPVSYRDGCVHGCKTFSDGVLHHKDCQRAQPVKWPTQQDIVRWSNEATHTHDRYSFEWGAMRALQAVAPVVRMCEGALESVVQLHRETPCHCEKHPAPKCAYCKLYDDAEAALAAIRTGEVRVPEALLALQTLKALMSNPHIDLGDLIYNVREREGLGWEGPAVVAWAEAVKRAQQLVEQFKSEKR